MSQAYLNTPTLIAPALASFTHRHLKLDADRQAHELHRLASLRSGGFLLEELAELSKLLVLASRAPHVAQLVPVLARVVRLCGSAQPRADRSSSESRSHFCILVAGLARATSSAGGRRKRGRPTTWQRSCSRITPAFSSSRRRGVIDPFK